MVTRSLAVPSSSQMTKVRWTPSRSRSSSAGLAAGRGENGDLGVGAADVHRAAQGAAVRHDHLRVVPGHAGAGEGGGDRGDGGHDFDLQAELGGTQGAYDSEEAGVAVGEDDGAAAVARDAAGGEETLPRRMRSAARGTSGSAR